MAVAVISTWALWDGGWGDEESVGGVAGEGGREGGFVGGLAV